jgi:trk system potassium uptake protein TrkA
MYIIIAGCRKVGLNLALRLAGENHDVVVIDSDPNNLEHLGSGFNGLTVAGVPIDEDVLRNAGIEKADALAAVTDDDNMNVMISQVARELFHVPTVITRVYDPERQTVVSRMGLTAVCPATLAVDKITDMLMPERLTKSIDINGTKINLHAVRPGRRMIGKKIIDVKDQNIFGIIKNGHFYITDPVTEIGAGDTLIVPGYTE